MSNKKNRTKGVNMSNNKQVVKTKNNIVSIRGNYTDEQVELVKNTVAPKATNDELSLFLYQANKTGLDPLARQIVFQKFESNKGDDQIAIITTIDGYRLIAERSGKFAGTTKPVYEGEKELKYKEQEDGKWVDKKKIVPEKATVVARKIVGGQVINDFATGEARWDEFYKDGKPGFNWRKMPYHMLAKVAEALALRKAFPAELSGVYTQEEMTNTIPEQENTKVDSKINDNPEEIAELEQKLNEYVDKLYNGDWSQIYPALNVKDHDEFNQIKTKELLERMIKSMKTVEKKRQKN